MVSEYHRISRFANWSISQHPPSGTLIGELTPEAGEACGLPAGLPVIAGHGDGQAAGVGANISQSGQAYLSLGTSVVSGIFAQKYLIDRAFRTMYGIPEAYSLETVLLGGTYTIDWFMENFTRNQSVADLETEIQSIPPGSEGLLLIPYWNSALNPYWDANASGITIGWRGFHKPAHLYRAILEGIAFELRLHYEGAESALNTMIDQLIVMGGGSRSDLWCQMIADITGKVIQRTNTTEATALGAGILAASGTGLYPDIYQAMRNMSQNPETSFEPNRARNGDYTQLYRDVFIKVYPALQSLMKNLASLSER